MKEPCSKSTRFWLLVLAVILAVAVLGLLVLRANRQSGSQVQVTQDGAVVATFPLAQDATYRYESTGGGYNVVQVQGSQVAVIAASCPDQICIRHGPTDQTADPIVCLPNKLVVQVLPAAGETEALDGVSS